MIKELVEKYPAMVEAKRKIDRVIDICGPTPKGTGLQNMREAIIESKWKYDVSTEDKQVLDELKTGTKNLSITLSRWDGKV